ncbi:MAG: class I SAM-dependent methyltransferase [Chloroflexota bacterium]
MTTILNRLKNLIQRDNSVSSRNITVTDTLYEYILNNSLRDSDILRRLREETSRDREGDMQVGPEQGQFLGLLVTLLQAKRTIEVGVFTGYSTLCTALALPEDGQLIACDVSDVWTSVGQRYWQEAGVAHKIELHLAPAAETLEGMLEQDEAGKFDFAFIDADKTGYDTYYEQCLKLIRSGGLIAIDNVLWGGAVANSARQDSDTQALRELNAKLHKDERIHLSLLPIGDGVTLAVKK